MGNTVVWVELPAKDIARAAKFYGALFGATIEVNDDGVREIATLPHEGVGVSLTQIDGFEPADGGVFVYLDASGKLEEMVARVAPAGGTVVTERADLGGGAGFYTTIRDTEGNLIALYTGA
jgi:hypothetical protein